jgi:hypothetical protein
MKQRITFVSLIVTPHLFLIKESHFKGANVVWAYFISLFYHVLRRSYTFTIMFWPSHRNPLLYVFRLFSMMENYLPWNGIWSSSI